MQLAYSRLANILVLCPALYLLDTKIPAEFFVPALSQNCVGSITENDCLYSKHYIGVAAIGKMAAYRPP
jgi:hypothetical protein